MRIFKRKLLPILLTCMLLLAALPTVIFASAEPAVVSNEKELIEAVDAVKQGGTGEITLLLALAFVSACLLFGTNKVLKKSRKN